MGQKRSDLETIPLCRLHHDEQHRIGWKRFTESYSLDVVGLVRALREKPRLWIGLSYNGPSCCPRTVYLKSDRAEFYHATCRGLTFRVCRADEGPTKAWSLTKDRCREILIEQLFTAPLKHGA